MNESEKSNLARILSLRWFIVAQVWAFVLALPELVYVTQPTNRYFLHWSFDEWLVRISSVCAIGLVIYLLGLIVRAGKEETVLGIGGILGVLTVGFFLGKFALVTWTSNRDLFYGYMPLICVILLIVGVVFWRFKLSHRELGKFFSAVCTIFAPILLVYWGNLLLVPKYNQGHDGTIESLQMTQVTANGSAEPEEQNIYIFLLDGWPQRLTLNEDGKIDPRLENLAAFANESCLLTDAHSPGCHTFVSVPRLLFQNTDQFVLNRGDTGFASPEFQSTSELDSIFDQANRHGYQTYLVGWYHPYHTIFGDRIDFLKTVPYYNELGSDFRQRVYAFYWRWGGKMLGQFARNTIGDEEIMRNYAMANQTHESVVFTSAILEQKQQGQFAVFHLPVPHWPFCMDQHGPKNLNVAYDRDSDQAALEQLIYTDGLLGEFVEILKQNGKYENSTIVLTSDHNWRTDPELDKNDPEAVSHIPTLIKFAGQTEGTIVSGPFSTNFLSEFIFEKSTPQQQMDHLRRKIATKNFYTPLPKQELDAKQLLRDALNWSSKE